MRRALACMFAVLSYLAAEPVALQGASRPGEIGETGEQVRFFSLDVFIDSGRDPLAAWQIEIEDLTQRAKLVGVEGGAHPAYAEPAFHDPRALQGGRVILGAFSLRDDLPVERTRVARLHWSVTGLAEPEFRAELQAAASYSGTRISPILEVSR